MDICNMSSFKCWQIIHIFAAIHAVIVLLCALLNIDDELLLTCATISLITIIALKKGQGMGIIATCAIAGNIVGFVIGTYGADLLAKFITSPILMHSLTSFITTEIIGFGFLLLYNFLGGGKSRYDLASFDLRPVVWMMLGLLLIRLVYSKIFGGTLSEEVVNIALRLLLGNSLAIITLIASNVIYHILSNKYKTFSTPVVYVIELVASTLLIAAATTLIIGYNLPFGTEKPFDEVSFVQLFSILIIASLIIYVIIVMITYVYQTRNRIENEQEKRRLAQFQYNILKQQVNPHFLFNSLNILNGLIEEGKNSEATEYVLKLAALYRYMLQNENEHLVRLQEELEFIEKYTDLLKVRFPKGFELKYNIDEDAKSRFVVQCSLQVLIENAFKHNIVRVEQPLCIEIFTDDGYIVVRNNIQHKSSSADSTKVGLKNISKQYMNAVGLDILITRTDDLFEVKLPLI